MDNNNEPAILVHTVPDSVFKFYRCRNGLYYFYTSSTNIYLTILVTLNLSLLPSKRTRIFHISKIEGADASRIIQRAIGFLSITRFKVTVKGNQLQNCPITVSGIERSGAIHVPQVAILKKTPANVQDT